MWSDADIFVDECDAEDLERAFPGNVGERWRQSLQLSSPAIAEEDFKEDFDVFSLKLFCAAHATILSVLADLVLTLAAGMTRYMS